MRFQSTAMLAAIVACLGAGIAIAAAPTIDRPATVASSSDSARRK